MKSRDNNQEWNRPSVGGGNEQGGDVSHLKNKTKRSRGETQRSRNNVGSTMTATRRLTKVESRIILISLLCRV